ncbi:MAG: hypothetical protein LBO81_06145 [Clostridiales Family XIII bacterium]|jgi:hypothetical protein|nr:hypothetical protein [Clostridiales Family XIII bacterium]
MRTIPKRATLALSSVILAFAMFAGGCVFSLSDLVALKDTVFPPAPALTETWVIEENGTVSIHYPESFKRVSADGALELYAPEYGVGVVVYPIKRNLEGYTFETLASRFDSLTRDPWTGEPITFVGAQDGNAGNGAQAQDGSDTRSNASGHKAYYRQDGVHCFAAYLNYFGTHSAVGFAYYLFESSQRACEEAVDAIFAAIQTVPEEDLDALLKANRIFAPVPREFTHYARLTEDFERRTYERLLEAMRTFVPQEIPIEDERWWLDYSILAAMVVSDHPELRPYYHDEFGARITPEPQEDGTVDPDGAQWNATEDPDIFDEFWNRTGFRVAFRPVWDDGNEETADTEAMKAVFSDIESQAEAILAAMPAGLTVYGRYRYLAETVFAMIEYDTDVANLSRTTPDFYRSHLRASSVYGAFIDRRAICGGYADAYRYLCERANLACRVIGTDDHALNLITLHGGTYYVDPTNGVTAFEDTGFAFSHEELLASGLYSDIRGEADDIAAGAAY